MAKKSKALKMLNSIEVSAPTLCQPVGGRARTTFYPILATLWILLGYYGS